MTLRERLLQSVMILDGAMGTQLQDASISAKVWAGHEGCNEWLNRAAPDLVAGVHRAFFSAGCDAVETNSFGASALTLAEYGLAAEARALNRAAAEIAGACAREAGGPEKPRFVWGSVGPGVRLATLGQVTWEELLAAYRAQVEGLVEGGVDGLLIETCQDPLQIKAVLAAAEDVLGDSRDMPRYVSVTVESSGTLLIGSSVTAVAAILAPYAVDILGLNCATGPEAMRSHVLALGASWPGLIGCMPNAGLPVMEKGVVRYPMAPAPFAAAVSALAEETGLQVVGGCCGTTPDHIRALANALAGRRFPPGGIRPADRVSSLFSPVDLDQRPAPLLIGERANATGSRKFRDTLLAEDHEAAFHILVEQEEAGSHVLDLSCAFAGRDERRDVELLVERAARECRAPLMIDTTRTDVVDAALRRYGGRAIINSIHFEDGEERAGAVVRLARRFGAALVGLTIDEQGMAMTAERKFDVARRLVDFCGRHGLPPGALLVDALTFTIGSGDPALRNAAQETLEAIRRIKADLPGVRTVLGLSNISFGLKPVGRRVLNAVFLDRALKAGLDACIINVAQITPLAQMPPADRAAAESLVDNRREDGDPLEAFIRHFDRAVEVVEGPVSGLPPEAVLRDAVVRGRPAGLASAVPALLERLPAEAILNEHLVPAMGEVGRLFNEGELQLPFVLKSAEVMKKAVDLIRPHFLHAENEAVRGTLVLATVAGDVHDIGKNLVDIILSNNGYRVVNLGTRVPVERMMAAVREHQADALGMSGLLVKSALIMEQNLQVLDAEGLRVPVLLGGAALTPEFVRDACVPRYRGPVAYCRDAFAGLSFFREFQETGGYSSAPVRVVSDAPSGPAPGSPADPIELTVPVPTPPFFGARVVDGCAPESILTWLDEKTILCGRWGFRRGRLTTDAYRDLIRNEAAPHLQAFREHVLAGDLFEPRAVWGWFRCRAQEDTLWVDRGAAGPEIPLLFPRQSHAPFLSLPDFFRPDGDVVGFLAVTLGAGVGAEEERLRAADRYREYMFLHGFAVELAEALTQYGHARMRAELGFRDDPAEGKRRPAYRGERFGFGYPSCPDVSMNRVICDLLEASRIGITLSETDMMIPELSTCALVAHHPQARHFFMEPGNRS